MPKDLALLPTMVSFVLSSRVERVINFGGGGCSNLPDVPSMLLLELFCLCTEATISLKLSLIAGVELVAIVTSAEPAIEMLEYVCSRGLCSTPPNLATTVHRGGR